MNFIEISYELYYAIKLDVPINTFLILLVLVVLCSFYLHFIPSYKMRNKDFMIAYASKSFVFKVASLSLTNENHHCKFLQNVVCKHLSLSI